MVSSRYKRYEIFVHNTFFTCIILPEIKLIKWVFVVEAMISLL